jgi:hypothetical protein
MMTTEQRIMLIDGHIIAQFNQFTGPMNTPSWYTMSRSEHNDEQDFAVWAFSQVNLAKAYKLITGECKLIEVPSNYHVTQHADNKWYIHRGDLVDVKVYDSQNEALRNLARSL